MKRFLSPFASLAAALLAAPLLLSPTAARAGEFLIHPLFTDHAVLQQELPVPVWGWGDPDAKVVVEFAGQRKETSVEGNGLWMALLDPLKANATPAVLTASSAGKTHTVSDILVGEVWLCSGQSNMAMNVQATTDAASAQADAAGGKLSALRLFRVPVAGADERADTVDAIWKSSTAETVAAFSATGFYFGRALHQSRGVPVGLIQSANGGTNAYSWIHPDTFLNDPVGAPARAVWEAAVKNFPAATANYEKAKAAWAEKVKAAREVGQPLPAGRAPQPPLGPGHPKRPAGHYNAMIAPLAPFAIRGAIWYQGEANSRPPFADQYRDLMFALVEDWRETWSAGTPEIPRRDFPFYLVQLPNFGGGSPQGWPLIREQMLRFWQDGKNTGMAVAIDVGDSKDIHPKNKKPVGERLALFARADAYGEKIVHSGPIFDSFRVEDGKSIVTFAHVGGGLLAADGQALRHFEIAGESGPFVPAKAEISGETVVVTGEGITNPRAVRYAWKADPVGINFFNREGLPASPFRTDTDKINLEEAPTPAVEKTKR